MKFTKLSFWHYYRYNSYEIAHEEYKKAIDKVLDICSGSVDRQVVKYHFDIAWAVFMQIYRKKIDGIRFTDFISSALNDPRFGYHAEKPIVDQEAIVKKLRESQKQKQKEET